MTDETISSHAPALPEQSSPLNLDRSRYEAEMALLDLSDAQSDELLRTLWALLQNMVTLNYSVRTFDICGSIFGPFSEAAKSSSDLVESPSESKDREAGNDDQ